MNLRGAIGSVALVCLAVPLVGGIGVGASADTLLVSPDGTGEYPTIQGAIDAAVDGDVIELADGTYRGEGNRDIEYLGKAITVQSASGDPTACILNCEGPGNRGFHFRHDEGPASVLVGVTVMNGSPPGVWSFDGGGAIRCNPNASPTIANCVFRDNWAINGSDWSWDGGAIAAYSTPGPSVTNCSFFDNTADEGGAIYGSFSVLRGCTFAGNEGLLYGGTIVYLFNNPTVENCTIVDNIGVGVVIVGDSGEILGSNIAFNHGAAVTGSPSGTITLTCCNLFGNEGGDWTGAIAGQLGMRGNINLDPLFCGLETRDFGLQSGSPCGPEYNPKCGLIGAWPVGCAGAPARTTTWGALKSLFREPSK